MDRAIELRGGRAHNLKSIDLNIPLGKLTVVCGVSGSGKTSLAIDTLYAEGQRRFIESFSAYTRQFLERMDKPDYDTLENLPPATAVLKQTTALSNRSTVGTSTEIVDYLRLLYSKIAEIRCIRCDSLVQAHSPQTIAAYISQSSASGNWVIAFSFEWSSRQELSEQLAELQQSGFVRLILQGRMIHLARDDRASWAPTIPEQGIGWVAVDRVKPGSSDARVTESLETAFDRGDGELALLVPDADQPSGGENNLEIDGIHHRLLRFGSSLQCVQCGIEYPQPEPRLFSFNSPIGACSQCEGFGEISELDWTRIVPDPKKTIRGQAIAPWSTPAYLYGYEELLACAKSLKIPLDVPFQELTDQQRTLILEGSEKHEFGGLKGFFEQLDRKKYKMHVRIFIQRWRSYRTCPGCNGRRLKEIVCAYRIADHHIAELCSLQVGQTRSILESVVLDDRQRKLVKDPLKSILERLRYLEQVGLGYLTIDRVLRTLSGGEAQRVALTAALGSDLTSMLYVLDEPTVGLHPHDTQQLVGAIQQLRDRGNTVLVVEHEPPLMENADWIVEIGPEAGEGGGKVTFQGTPKQMKVGSCLTADYLKGHRGLSSNNRRPTNRGWIGIRGASGNNLRKIDVDFPLGVLCVVTGVSGSGKSSLVQDTLFGALSQRLDKEPVPTLPFVDCVGEGQIDDLVMVDQSPISRSPRSIPATYIKAFDEIRSVFASSVDAKMRNLSSSHFSFNHEQGRCPDCEGSGIREIDMLFLANIQMKCPTCHGSRYCNEVLSVRYRDRSIADVLDMTCLQAHSFFRGHPKIQQRLQTLNEIGLGYIHLGQSATTLSAGEGQRLKLASYLTAHGRKGTLFVLDEPTTGLHFQDVVRLLDCFTMLLDAGHSLIVVEHNQQVMNAADYIIDLGPGPAEQGGQIVAKGTPEEIAGCCESITGRYLSIGS